MGVLGGEEEGFGLEHVDEVFVVEGVERRTFNIPLQLMEGIARVLHTIGQDLPDFL